MADHIQVALLPGTEHLMQDLGDAGDGFDDQDETSSTPDNDALSSLLMLAQTSAEDFSGPVNSDDAPVRTNPVPPFSSLLHSWGAEVSPTIFCSDFSPMLFFFSRLHCSPRSSPNLSRAIAGCTLQCVYRRIAHRTRSQRALK